MKRFLIVIFALLYVGLSSGITLTIHQCMGKLVGVDIWQSETCERCGMRHDMNSCCSTQTQFLKISDDQDISQPQTVKYMPTVLSLLFELHDLHEAFETVKGIHGPVCHLTPFERSGTDRLVRHCTFLI